MFVGSWGLQNVNQQTSQRGPPTSGIPPWPRQQSMRTTNYWSIKNNKKFFFEKIGHCSWFPRESNSFKKIPNPFPAKRKAGNSPGPSVASWHLQAPPRPDVERWDVRFDLSMIVPGDQKGLWIVRESTKTK